MARKPRLYMKGVAQHVVQRGNNREPCFFTEEDYRYYLECLSDAARKYGCEIHAYVLMTNHVHLLVTPQEEYALSGMMQSIGRRYVRYINHTYKRTGTLWEGRFKAGLVQSENYLLVCSRYIELNPIRANMVETPDEYKWSSYSCNAWGKEDECIIAHSTYLQLGGDEKERREAYRELFCNHMDNDLLHQVRKAVNQESILGSSYFKEKIEEVVRKSIKPERVDVLRVEEIAGAYVVY